MPVKEADTKRGWTSCEALKNDHLLHTDNEALTLSAAIVLGIVPLACWLVHSPRHRSSSLLVGP